MKKRILFLAALLALLLSACSGSVSCPAEDPMPGERQVISRYKIMDVCEYEGNYSVLAVNWEAERSELTFVGIRDAELSGWDGAVLSAADLRPGMIVDVTWGGMVAESWPCQIHVDKVQVVKQGDDLVGLCRQVITDLWAEDSGLNGGAEILGFDFSTLTNLADCERTALEYLVSCDVGLGLQYVTGTWEELCEQGYIDRENLYWENGVFLSITLEEEGSGTFRFEAEKWRSGLGAIFFTDCTAKRGCDGKWSYEIGGFAIA